MDLTRQVNQLQTRLTESEGREAQMNQELSDYHLLRKHTWHEYEGIEASISHIDQRYPGDIRDISPRIEKKIREYLPRAKTLYEAIKTVLPEADVKCAVGCNAAGSNLSDMENALGFAANSDIVILTLGGKCGWGITSTCGEGVDSTNIGLPGNQEYFVRRVYELHKKTIVIHFDGRPMANEYVASHFDATIEAWQPAEYGGEVLADILCGACNPSGRLAVTVAREPLI